MKYLITYYNSEGFAYTRDGFKIGICKKSKSWGATLYKERAEQLFLGPAIQLREYISTCNHLDSPKIIILED